MANLLATVGGLEKLRQVACFLAKERMSFRLKRSFFLAYDAWKSTGHFDMSVLLDSLNPLNQDEIDSIGDLANDLACTSIATTSEMTIYVDSVAGSDLTGDGSSSQPYASLGFLDYPSWPLIINHPVRVVIVHDLVAGDISLNPIFGPNGSLAFIGAGDPIVKTTSLGDGPFQATLIGGLNGVGYLLQYTGLPFGADEMYGYFVRTKPAPDSVTPNHAVQMHHHSNTFPGTFVRDAFPMSSNDWIDFVRPPVTITLNSLNLEARGPAWEDTDLGSRLAFFNLNLDVSASTRDNRLIRLKSTCDTIMSFCRVIYGGSQTNIFEIWSDLNRYACIDAGAAALCNSMIENIDGDNVSATNAGLLFVNTGFMPVSFALTEMRICAGQHICCVDSRASIAAYNSFGRITKCAISLLSGHQGASGHLRESLVAACSGSVLSGAIVLEQAGLFHLSDLYLYGGGGKNILAIKFGDARISDCEVQSATSFSGYGIEYFGIGRVLFTDDPVAANWVGAGGQIFYDAAVAGLASLPAINSATTELDAATPPASGDVLGGVVTYI